MCAGAGGRGNEEIKEEDTFLKRTHFHVCIGLFLGGTQGLGEVERAELGR